MNERIRLLALEAGGSHYPEVGGEVLEKFAELVVRECCDVLQNEDIRHSGYGYNQGFLHKKIKEHFGVEEPKEQSAVDRILSTIRTQGH